jgi:hypothetical protein
MPAAYIAEAAVFPRMVHVIAAVIVAVPFVSDPTVAASVAVHVRGVGMTFMIAKIAVTATAIVMMVVTIARWSVLGDVLVFVLTSIMVAAPVVIVVLRSYVNSQQEQSSQHHQYVSLHFKSSHSKSLHSKACWIIGLLVCLDVRLSILANPELQESTRGRLTKGHALPDLAYDLGLHSMYKSQKPRTNGQ